MQATLRSYLDRLNFKAIIHRSAAAPPAYRKAVHVALIAGVVASIGLAAAVPLVTHASDVDVLANGSFEHGFTSIPGCGVVGAQWDCFTNGGAANYGFYDDQWDQVVADGKHAQLIEVNTKGLAAGDADRYAGIGQTVRVAPWGHYKLSLRGIIRTTNQEGDPWRYRVQVGWVPGPNADWRQVNNWTDLGWNDYYKREEPGAISAFQTVLMPGDSPVVTLFVRVWKKWGVAYEELDVDLDSISLVGPPAGGPEPKGGPQADKGQSMSGGPDMRQPGAQGGTGGPEMGMGPQDGMWQPNSQQPQACGGPDLLFNGSFEQGFNYTALGEVGRGWAPLRMAAPPTTASIMKSGTRLWRTANMAS